MARAVMQQLARFGEVRRGRLGISMQDAAGREGAAIVQVQPGSPAERAGLRAGDIVTTLNGRPVQSAAELRAQLGVIPAGETVEMRVQRGAETPTVRTKIGEIESRQVPGGESVAQLPGATLANAERQSARGRERLVLVAAVQEGSPAFQHGLRSGDLIVGVNRRRTATVAELGKALAAGGRVALNILRGDFQLTLTIRVGREG